MPTSALGQLNCEIRPKVYRTAPADLPTVSASANVSSRPTKKSKYCSVPKGLIPTILYSLFFISFPLLSHFTSIDFGDTEVRVAVIASSFVASVIILLANDCVAWFNMALFFHLGIEITVIDTLVDYIDAPTTNDTGTALAWVAVAVIAIHLLPFFTMDHSSLLTLLASAGVVVNTSALVFVEPSMLLLTAFSAAVLLACVLLIACIECVRTSLLSQLRQACTEGTWIVCSNYEM